MNNFKVRVVNNSKNDLPKYETKGSAGMDIRASLHADFNLVAGDRALIPTGIHVELPEGYEIQVRPRSGLALKHGITVLNSPGTIDADYRGEIGVILFNTSKEDFLIKDGERIAQLVVNKIPQIEWEEVLFVTETVRGNGGFGSTGK